MKKSIVSRPVEMPDMLRIARYEKAPEYGPRMLFFSGGSALNETSRVLKKFTHNSIHLVTPFDSGGSSAILRKAFNMPAVGDLRSRMMALADETISGNPEIFKLFAYRLSKDASKEELYEKLKKMALGKEARVMAIKNPMRKLIMNHLDMFIKIMPSDFDLRGASIGNLILSAGYLHHNHKLDPVLFMFSKLVNVLGQVHVTVNDRLHLGARLEDGRIIHGQHLLTGKEAHKIDSPIDDFYLIEELGSEKKSHAVLQKKKKKLILQSDLICYSPGSFYTSLIANLLPKGVGQAIEECVCPKVYVPSLGKDPERLGLSIDHSIFKLLSYLKRDCADTVKERNLLTHVFIDSQNGEKLKPETIIKLEKFGVDVMDVRLISADSKPYYDPQLLVIALLSLT